MNRTHLEHVIIAIVAQALFTMWTVLYDRRYWSLDGVLDFVLPAIAVALVALLLTVIK